MAELKFNKTHEWAKIEENTAVIGITDYAQTQLGDIVFIEVPSVGDKIEKASQFATIESTKAAGEIYAPLSGEVIEVNSEAINNPQWINESPLDKGWMIKIKIDKEEEINELMDETSYREFVAKESH
jgi:glycine cleavage system H protein